MGLFDKLRVPGSSKTSPPASESQQAPRPGTIGPSGPTTTWPAAGPSGTETSAPTKTPGVPGVKATGQTAYLQGRPGFARALWASHPNKTTRKLRRLLVSWEELGFFLSFSGTPPAVSPAAEKSFLKVKVAVAKSISVLKSIRGMGDIGKEAGAKEREFLEILECYPSLYAASDATDEDKRELFAAWHSLYLFLHRVLGAAPREVSSESALVPLRRRGESEGAARNVRPFRAGKTA